MNDTDAPVALEWSMTRHEATLTVSYTLTNRSARPILVFDTLVVRGSGGVYRRAPGRGVVKELRPGVAGLFLCATSAMTPMAWLVPPVLQPLAPQASVTGSFEAPLPLTPWHNLGPAGAFSQEPKAAVLRVAYLADEPKWHELKGEGGEVIKVALNGSVTTVAGDERPIP